jgi:hypothetical protein
MPMSVWAPLAPDLAVLTPGCHAAWNRPLVLRVLSCRLWHMVRLKHESPAHGSLALVKGGSR